MQARTPAVDEDVDPPKRKATVFHFFTIFAFNTDKKQRAKRPL